MEHLKEIFSDFKTLQYRRMFDGTLASPYSNALFPSPTPAVRPHDRALLSLTGLFEPRELALHI
ncbi:MAG: hypothetical protein NPIRA05_16740 [Nitrospirales bacterium]|nr:MAG: hypothetical protein NPIRA05_16740 [Nitrospirales bacterium]